MIKLHWWKLDTQWCCSEMINIRIGNSRNDLNSSITGRNFNNPHVSVSYLESDLAWTLLNTHFLLDVIHQTTCTVSVCLTQDRTRKGKGGSGKKKCEGVWHLRLTEAMQSEGESLGGWLGGQPEGQQRKQNAHHIGQHVHSVSHNG